MASHRSSVIAVIGLICTNPLRELKSNFETLTLKHICLMVRFCMRTSLSGLCFVLRCGLLLQSVKNNVEKFMLRLLRDLGTTWW